MTATFFEQVEKKRKLWTPVAPVKEEYVVEGAEETISRALALRCLEIPVKGFIQEGLDRTETKAIGKEGLASLNRNIVDEENHDTALNNCVRVFKDYNSKVEKEAEELKNMWINHPDFPITKAAVLENGVFFVVLPLYRMFGSPSLRTASFDISADEVNHVQIHRYVAKELGFKPSTTLDNLRKITVRWLLEFFNVPGYDKDRFIKASDNLMYKGVTDQLDFTQSYQVNAFFEKRNDVQASYDRKTSVYSY